MQARYRMQTPTLTEDESAEAKAARAAVAARVTAKAELELAQGCTICGSAWRVHYLRGGEYRGCRRGG